MKRHPASRSSPLTGSLVMALAVLAAASRPAAAQVHRLTDADHPLLAVGHRFVEARNTLDGERRLTLLGNLMGGSDSPKTSASRFLGDLQRLGGTFEPVAYYSVGGGLAIHVVGRESRSGDWTRYQLGLDPERPGRIGMIAQTDSRPPPSLPGGVLTDERAGRFIDENVRRIAAESGFSGALLVARGDGVVYEAYVGRADDRTGADVTPGTPMDMASGGKMFTSVLIGKAVEAGRLDWDDPVRDLVPSLRDAPWSRAVTIRRLLTHTSGLPEYWDAAFEAASGRISTLNQIVPFFIGKELEFTPGERAEYSNTNFIVLGLVLETLSESSYPDQVRDEVLQPVGMSATTLTRSDRTAVAYEPTAPGEWRPVTLDLPPSSAGGAASTSRDLLKFADALRQHRLLTAATLAHMTSAHARLGGGTAYGLGFEVAPDGAYWGHGGRGPGVTFDFRVYPADELVVIAMSNRDGSGYLDLLLTVDEVLARLVNGG